MTSDNSGTPLPPPLPTGPLGQADLQLPYPMAYQPVAWAPMQAPSPPRVWTAIVAPVIAGIVALVAATVTLLAAALIHLGPHAMTDQAAFMKWVESYGATPVGFLVLVLPGQLTFLAAGLIAARLSPVPTAERLGLKKPSVSWWIILLLLPATGFSSICGELLMRGIFGDQGSENLTLIHNLFRGLSGVTLLLITLVISVLPGFSEEMLFRGYAQRRLLQRWHPAAAIALSSVLFAAAHVDPAHVVAVLPLGIWFGVIAWLTGSIWPALICHIINNVLAVLVTNSGVADPTDHFTFDAAGIGTLAMTATFTALSIWVMWRARKSEIAGARETN